VWLCAAQADDVEAGRGAAIIEEIERGLDEKKKQAAAQKAKEVRARLLARVLSVCACV
jgi:hypothetical protein